jgi:hypothetical protein
MPAKICLAQNRSKSEHFDRVNTSVFLCLRRIYANFPTRMELKVIDATSNRSFRFSNDFARVKRIAHAFVLLSSGNVKEPRPCHFSESRNEVTRGQETLAESDGCFSAFLLFSFLVDKTETGGVRFDRIVTDVNYRMSLALIRSWARPRNDAGLPENGRLRPDRLSFPVLRAAPPSAGRRVSGSAL